jgi:metal-responsive CopG/Arc/MetJ family transcriptional regulator
MCMKMRTVAAMAKKPEKEEASGSVGVSVRLPESLLIQIDRLAEQERRTRGNMIRILLEDALKARE